MLQSALTQFRLFNDTVAMAGYGAACAFRQSAQTARFHPFATAKMAPSEKSSFSGRHLWRPHASLGESAGGHRGTIHKRLQQEIPIGVLQSAVALVEQPPKVLGLGSAILDAFDRKSKHLVPRMLFLGKELVQSHLEPR
ncbi:MAG: hypothetical protein E5X56_25710 [Mesorhizobium sp.]|nr:hypothetical protein [Mesorhizobium sp.]TIP56174.1 MAG: hypothetical protein E5X56_25710 [Mesorhizobium sp.]TJW46342.1 MAG: hypothetical protein E5X59_15865 [Mesorhizobium sp.]